MARRHSSGKKRKYAGNRTYGGGNKKNRRGKGSRGGTGFGGYHKHKRMKMIKMGPRTFKKGIQPQGKTIELKLSDLSAELRAGKWPNESGVYKVSLPTNCKLISAGKLTHKIELSCEKITEGAKNKIVASGGKVLLAPSE